MPAADVPSSASGLEGSAPAGVARPGRSSPTPIASVSPPPGVLELAAALGNPDDPPAAFASGHLLGKYQIVRELGAGGMGAVYEAIHTGISKPVALKTLSGHLASDPRAQARFLREAASASRLDHPHVVDVTDFGTEGGVSFIVMELLRGEDLAALIARHPGGVPVETMADVLLAVCAGVFAAHEVGVVHRDLKPQNIFLARTPIGETVPKVLDFGISKVLDEPDKGGLQLTHTGMVIGTTHYLSPEQVSGRPVDGRSDQYALGVILYEGTTGQRPHEGDTFYAIMRSIGDGTFKPPRALRPDLPVAFERIVLRAMAQSAQDRFESVHALGRALLPFASPKRRVMWSDYFEHGRPGVAALQPVPLDAPQVPRVGPPPATRTAVLAGSTELPPTRTRAREGGVPTNKEVEEALSVGPVAVPGTFGQPLVAPRRLAPVALWLVGAALVAGGLYFGLVRGGLVPGATAPISPTARTEGAETPPRGAGGTLDRSTAISEGVGDKGRASGVAGEGRAAGRSGGRSATTATDESPAADGPEDARASRGAGKPTGETPVSGKASAGRRVSGEDADGPAEARRGRAALEPSPTRSSAGTGGSKSEGKRDKGGRKPRSAKVQTPADRSSSGGPGAAPILE